MDCVIDASKSKSGVYVFLGIEKNGYNINPNGINCVDKEVPEGWRLVGVVHKDGGDAAHDWGKKHKEEIIKLGYDPDKIPKGYE